VEGPNLIVSGGGFCAVYYKNCGNLGCWPWFGASGIILRGRRLPPAPLLHNRTKLARLVVCRGPAVCVSAKRDALSLSLSARLCWSLAQREFADLFRLTKSRTASTSHSNDALVDATRDNRDYSRGGSRPIEDVWRHQKSPTPGSEKTDHGGENRNRGSNMAKIRLNGNFLEYISKPLVHSYKTSFNGRLS
jgi:hypothetical protein